MPNTDEYVEILDGHGDVTTVTLAHADPLLHGIAVVFVFSPDDKLYVQVRNESGFRKEHTAEGTWI